MLNKILIAITLLLAVLVGVLAVSLANCGRKTLSDIPDAGTGAGTDGGNGAEGEPKASFSALDKLVLASYYPWYGFKDSNWADQILDPPLFGSYNSADLKLIKAHLGLAYESGIDAFLMSWTTEGENPDKVLQQMLDEINSSDKYGNFKVGIYYESVYNHPDSSDETFAKDFSYIISKYGNNNALLKVDGKPVIFVYTPDQLPVGRWETILARVSSKAFYVAAPNSWDFDLGYLDSFDSVAAYGDKYITDADLLKAYSDASSRLASKGEPLISTIFGGCGRVQKMGFDIDRSDGKYIQQRYNVAKQAGANWIYITSWNEWYEGNQLDPSRDCEFRGTKAVREMAASFKGITAAPLSGASISKSGSTIINNGKQNVYALKCSNNSSTISYLLGPNETASVSSSCSSAEGYLVDGAKVSTSAGGY